MSVRAGVDIEARLAALRARVDDSLTRAHEWNGPFELLAHAEPAAPAESIDPVAVFELRDQLQRAESTASLQAQRCTALEDRIIELEAALTRAKQERSQAESKARLAREELESQRSGANASERSGPLDENFQSLLLDNDRLRNERKELRRSLARWREQAQELKRERDELSSKSASTGEELAQLRLRYDSVKGRIAELERTIVDQERELERAKARTEHMRDRMRLAAR